MAGDIQARLAEDMKAALKAGEEGRLELSVIRLARAALQNAAIEKRKSLTEDEVIETLAREVKQRKEAAAEYEGLGRQDAAARLLAEAAVIQRYLPEPLSEDELRRIVSEAIAATGAASRRDLGKVMGKVMPLTRGRADGRRVNELARELLPEA
ncbi:MAG: GatB/YqeY domain-containing protein [Bacillota bacterium]